MYRISVVAAMCGVGLGFAAPPALADASWNGPNCQGSTVSAAVMGIGAKEAAASFGLSVQEAQDFVRAACASATTTPPRCEAGQSQAAQQALERGDFDQYLFHLGALENCFLGDSPGPPL
jgi:hypothetical protein